MIVCHETELLSDTCFHCQARVPLFPVKSFAWRDTECLCYDRDPCYTYQDLSTVSILMKMCGKTLQSSDSPSFTAPNIIMIAFYLILSEW